QGLRASALELVPGEGNPISINHLRRLLGYVAHAASLKRGCDRLGHALKRRCTGATVRGCKSAGGGAGATEVLLPVAEERFRDTGALERDQTELRREAAVRRETAGRSRRAHDAMARDDDGKRIALESLAHRARGARFPQPPRDLSIRQRPARWN